MPSPLEVWENFFLACDLPTSVSKRYAQRFVKERMQPSILNELGKEELKELGIDTIGDQLSVLRYIKKYGSAIPKEFRTSAEEEEKHSSDEDELMESEPAGKFLAPDRDEIYHIKMPAGITPKTKSILERQSILRNKGVIKRGTSGVRVSGTEISRGSSALTKLSNASKTIRKKAVMIQDISSSSSMPSIGSMRSDAISSKTIIVAESPRKKQAKVVAIDKIRNIPTHRERTVSSTSHPDFRVRLDMGPQQTVVPKVRLNVNPRQSIAPRVVFQNQPNIPVRRNVFTARNPARQVQKSMTGSSILARVTPVQRTIRQNVRPIQRSSNILDRISISGRRH
ncbi:hypothetical protein DdX_04911 [Ditylenchus destructor]|uniref:SAM domain-containing protein n=1 Tax=Ditylenchus destructor TaxID=166010 RepID=A0AAD4NA23_9BILA|nr:hypothetical protein DdX_04911 [Ditylenchus destructor]